MQRLQLAVVGPRDHETDFRAAKLLQFGIAVALQQFQQLVHVRGGSNVHSVCRAVVVVRACRVD
jgi:hypothetical protein